MKVTFESKLGKIVNDPRKLRAKYGLLAESILVAVSVLESADSLEDVPNVPPTRRHKLSGNYRGCWALDLNKSYRLIIAPKTDVDNPRDVTAVIIVEIVDCH